MISSFGQKMQFFKPQAPVEKPIPFAGNADAQSKEINGPSANAFASMAQKYNTQPLSPPVSFGAGTSTSGIPASAFTNMAQKYGAQPIDAPKMTGIGTSFMPAGALGDNAIASSKGGFMGRKLNLLG